MFIVNILIRFSLSVTVWFNDEVLICGMRMRMCSHEVSGLDGLFNDRGIAKIYVL